MSRGKGCADCFENVSHVVVTDHGDRAFGGDKSCVFRNLDFSTLIARRHRARRIKRRLRLLRVRRARRDQQGTEEEHDFAEGKQRYFPTELHSSLLTASVAPGYRLRARGSRTLPHGGIVMTVLKLVRRISVGCLALASS